MTGHGGGRYTGPPSTTDAEGHTVTPLTQSGSTRSRYHPTGRVHILVTPLLETHAEPAAGFVDLYHARWHIEAFHRIKHQLALEHLTGISWLAAQQDFGTKKNLSNNLRSLSLYCAANDTASPKKHRKSRTYSTR